MAVGGAGWREASEGCWTLVGAQSLTGAAGSCTAGVGSQSLPGLQCSVGYKSWQDTPASPGSFVDWGENECVLLLPLFLVFGPFSSSCYSVLQPCPVPAVSRCCRVTQNLVMLHWVLLRSLSMTNLWLWDTSVPRVKLESAPAPLPVPSHEQPLQHGAVGDRSWRSRKGSVAKAPAASCTVKIHFHGKGYSRSWKGSSISVCVWLWMYFFPQPCQM